MAFNRKGSYCSSTILNVNVSPQMKTDIFSCFPFSSISLYLKEHSSKVTSIFEEKSDAHIRVHLQGMPFSLRGFIPVEG